MFGYIKPWKPELKVRDFNDYQAVYCGLCGQLGRSFGCFARLTLSYDFTFLCMLRDALSPGDSGFAYRRCYVNPLRKVPVYMADEHLRFGAEVATIMIYYKLCDNIRDSAFPRKMGWYALYPAAAAAHGKAAASQPECEDILKRWTQRQADLEEQGSAGVDESCGPTAEAMAEIFGMLAPEERTRRILERMGYFTGRYIYLCDALDDLERDAKSGNYNPFLPRSVPDSPAADKLDNMRRNAKDSLFMTIAEIAKAYALLEIHKFGPILGNIVELGLRANVEDILSKAGGKPQ